MKYFAIILVLALVLVSGYSFINTDIIIAIYFNSLGILSIAFFNFLINQWKDPVCKEKKEDDC